MSSIRLRLLKCLIGPILLINLAGGALTYVLAWLPAQSAFDQNLGDAAQALVARLRIDANGLGIDLPKQAEQVLRADAVDAFYFVVRSDAGLVAGDADFPPLQLAALPGAPLAYDAVIHGEPVRVSSVALRAGSGPVQIGVAKTLRKRVQVRSAIVRTLLLLDLLFTAAVIVLIWFSVTRGLRPLARMRATLAAREGDDLSHIDTGEVPYELAPVVDAFNDLLGKVAAGTRAQHDFLANVAHQLRTPLAGLKLQLEWLGERHGADAGSRQSVQLMLQASERMIRQVNQLLSLARAEPSHFEKHRLEPFDLASLVEETVPAFVAQADQRGIDLGFDLAPCQVAGDRFLLRDLVDNLVDNALRYTPSGGSVTVRCRAGALMVEDSGPGIPPAKREAVFSRFVRLDDKTSGSGLGLAIVRDIASAHGATVGVAERRGGPGAVFTVRFPA